MDKKHNKPKSAYAFRPTPGREGSISEQEVRRLLVNAQEAERRRISRDLHDQLGQQLSALTLMLSLLRGRKDLPQEAGASLERLEHLARQADADLDFLVWELRPPTLDDLGLVEAIRDYASSWAEHFGTPVSVEHEGALAPRLDREVETVIYRVTQEILNNVAKHAQASRVTLRLARSATHIRLEVADDGVGFAPDKPFAEGAKGLGLVNIRERVMLVGGEVEFASGDGHGTTVRVQVPLPG